MNSLIKLSKELPFIIALTKFKKELDSFRPFPQDVENNVFQKLRLDWNYNSNAIEGNSFTRGETVSLIMEGVTAKGKPLKDALDIKGHNHAIDFVMSLIKEERSLSESDIRSLHKLVLGEDFFNAAETEDGKPTRKIIRAGQYKTQPNHVKTTTGEIHYYATPEETPAKMQELMAWYTEAAQTKGIHPVVLASLFHHKFVEIHPFDDGNGRMTRLLTNFILLKYGYPVSVVKTENRSAYYAALSQADNGQVIPIIEFISETVRDTFEIMLKGIHGEDISEEDDLDKEIELFRKEIGYRVNFKVLRDDVDIFSFLFELVKYPSIKLLKFSDLFINKLMRIEHNNIQVSFNENHLRNEEAFKTRMSESALKSVHSFTFRFLFNKSVYTNENVSLDKYFQVDFNDETYTISVLGNRLVKYYDEKIVDEKFIGLMRMYLKSFMADIKKNSKSS